MLWTRFVTGHLMGNVKVQNPILTQSLMPALGVSETFFCKILGLSYEKQEKEEVEVVTCRYCVYENTPPPKQHWRCNLVLEMFSICFACYVFLLPPARQKLLSEARVSSRSSTAEQFLPLSTIPKKKLGMNQAPGRTCCKCKALRAAHRKVTIFI